MNISIQHDGGFGYNYTATLQGVLIATGWIRCDLHVNAIRIVRELVRATVPHSGVEVD